MIKYFLIGSLIISILCFVYHFDQFANSDEKTEPIYYEKLLIEFGYFFNCLVILVVSLLFGWI
nr:MAG TPA: hypothetical protein [Caudoviricetes sp.]